MPRTKRDKAKNKLAQAGEHINIAIGYILDIGELFEDSHPEHAAYLKAICHNLAVSCEWIMKFFETTWGRRPPTFDHWRNN